MKRKNLIIIGLSLSLYTVPKTRVTITQSNANFARMVFFSNTD